MELWAFRFMTAILLSVSGGILKAVAELVAYVQNNIVTTANMRGILNWRLPILLLAGLLFILMCIWVELFSQISVCSDILNGRKTGIIPGLKHGFRSLCLFLSPAGIGAILLIVIAVPLTGFGFSVSATKQFYIPKFIMSVIENNLLFRIPMLLFLAVILFLNFRFSLAFHAAVIDGMKAKEALKHSWALTKKYGKQYFLRLVKVALISILIMGGAFLLFYYIPQILIELFARNIPQGYFFDIEHIRTGFTDQDIPVLTYRIWGSIDLYLGAYLVYVATALSTGWIMLTLTGAYYEYTGRKIENYYKVGGAAKTVRKTFSFVGMILLWTVAAVLIAFNFNQSFPATDPVGIVAHRTGGVLASENSLEGIDVSASLGCYAAETDIQRTADGHYIINHDKSFRRLTGVDKKPGEMTLDEIRELRITDTTGNGQQLPVPTMEELLDRGKEDGIVLFLELKGESADRKMADDIVAAVRERDMTDQVVLISLNYDALQYAEQTYPEFRTGLLIFGAIGDVSKLDCDIVIMEEEMSTQTRIDNIHDVGKEAMVWTVNKSLDLSRFLDMDVDGVITDEITVALEVQETLKNRTDMQVMRERTMDLFNR